MRFHLIDRIDGFEPWGSVRARKLTSRAESYWWRSPNGWVMPSPLILEALCQAGTWLVLLSTECGKRAALLSIESVAFLDPVCPGDVLEIEAALATRTDEIAVLSGRVSVDGRVVLEASEVMCTLLVAADLEDLESTRRMGEMLLRHGSAER